jgi:hypothetical protein
VGGGIPTAYGFAEYWNYFHPTSSVSPLNYKGIALTTANFTNLIQPSHDLILAISVSVPSKQIVVQLSFSYNNTGDYYFLVVLPFSITSLQNATCLVGCTFDSPQGPTSIHSTFQEIGGHTAIQIKYDGGQCCSESLGLEMNTPDNLVTGERGNDIFYLPVNVSPVTFYTEGGLKQFPIYPFVLGPTEYSVYVNVGLSSDDGLVSAHPLSYFPWQSNMSDFTTASTQWFNWNLTDNAQPVVVQFVDNSVSESYASTNFTSGVLIGVGISVIASVVIEFSNVLSSDDQNKSPPLDLKHAKPGHNAVERQNTVGREGLA